MIIAKDGNFVINMEADRAAIHTQTICRPAYIQMPTLVLVDCKNYISDIVTHEPWFYGPEQAFRYLSEKVSQKDSKWKNEFECLHQIMEDAKIVYLAFDTITDELTKDTAFDLTKSIACRIIGSRIDVHQFTRARATIKLQLYIEFPHFHLDSGEMVYPSALMDNDTYTKRYGRYSGIRIKHHLYDT